MAGCPAESVISHVTFGGEYEYRPTRVLGLGVSAEHTPEAHDGGGTTLTLASMLIHPWGGVRLGLGAGVEIVHEDDIQNSRCGPRPATKYTLVP